MFVNQSGQNEHSSVNGHFRVKTTEVRRVHVHSSLLVVASNQNASNKKKNRLNILTSLKNDVKGTEKDI
jgi:hypothetical protein